MPLPAFPTPRAFTAADFDFLLHTELIAQHSSKMPSSRTASPLTRIE
jgi:hypothetical protein